MAVSSSHFPRAVIRETLVPAKMYTLYQHSDPFTTSSGGTLEDQRTDKRTWEGQQKPKKVFT
ncbi:hypothetical protein RvY_01424 [Ramazzottius varieornatus]|uniref:Uncharacterized protein n=1 Tax=Ramazzottius varieornatus TaxID=947166 RepID=A0A1D1URI2_RAMVA|nr:hypothetical protein RvY_01424 [Ramazzottius varieornatus]